MSNIFSEYPSAIQRIFKQKLCLPILFDGQYRKRNFIINCRDDNYHSLLIKFNSIIKFIQNFLYEVQDRSCGTTQPLESPSIEDKARTFLRNIIIINSCNLNIFSIQYNDFPEIKENNDAYSYLLEKFSYYQSQYINEFCYISKKYGLYIYDLVSPCNIYLDVLLNNDAIENGYTPYYIAYPMIYIIIHMLIL